MMAERHVYISCLHKDIANKNAIEGPSSRNDEAQDGEAEHHGMSALGAHDVGLGGTGAARL